MSVRFTAQYSLFEGLYVRVLRPAGAFLAELKAGGFDLERPEPEYPIEVWVRCLDVTRQQLFPALPRFEAWERIGERLIDGFLETLAGRIVGTALPFLSPRTLVLRTPRFIRLGLPEVEVSLEWSSERDVAVHMVGPHEGAGRVLAGVGRKLLARLGVTPTLEVIERGNDSTLRIHWE